ncbi:hypothetical protein Bca52824_063231 [Brassica carinata]|uniref:Uncharacterized protein n=1 Tax=Brassica carinata TaxID=52824 RepID=A0A8X7QE01_BRACI|nr:hypothetical protein Bca52824_063231 [Brassica carinata]
MLRRRRRAREGRSEKEIRQSSNSLSSSEDDARSTGTTVEMRLELSKKWSSTLSSTQKTQIHLYVDTLLQWNQKMNLTETKEADEVMKRHIEDSLAILPPIRTCYSLQSSDQISLIDVGSGASLSGLWGCDLVQRVWLPLLLLPIVLAES